MAKKTNSKKPVKPELLEKQRQMAQILLKIPGLTKKRESEIREDLDSIVEKQLETAISQSEMQSATQSPTRMAHSNPAYWQSFHIVLNDGKSNASVGEITVYSSAETYDDFCQHQYDYMLEEKHQITIFRLEQTLTHQSSSNSVKIKFVNFIPSNLNLFDVEDWKVINTNSLTRKNIENSLVNSLGIVTKAGFSVKSYTKRLFSKVIGVLKKQYSDVILQTDFGGYLVKIGEIEISTANTAENCFQFLLITSKGAYLFYGNIDSSRYWKDLQYQKEICEQLKTFERVITVDSPLPLCQFFFKKSEMAD